MLQEQGALDERERLVRVAAAIDGADESVQLLSNFLFKFGLLL